MKTPCIFFCALFAASVAKADMHSCSEPQQICSGTNGINVYMDECSITCAEGVAAICKPGVVVNTPGHPNCYVQAENQCYCSGENRNVQTLGDHE